MFTESADRWQSHNCILIWTFFSLSSRLSTLSPGKSDKGHRLLQFVNTHFYRSAYLSFSSIVDIYVNKDNEILKPTLNKNLKHVVFI